MGHITEELQQFVYRSCIKEFVSCGQKNYAFSDFCPLTGKRTTKYKVKCLTFNYEN